MERSISDEVRGLMVGVAILVDAAQFSIPFLIPFVGYFFTPVITLVAALLFGMWFSHHGVSVFGPDRVLRFLTTLLVELPGGPVPLWWYQVNKLAKSAKESGSAV